jgi:hypothetical protein
MKKGIAIAIGVFVALVVFVVIGMIGRALVLRYAQRRRSNAAADDRNFEQQRQMKAMVTLLNYISSPLKWSSGKDETTLDVTPAPLSSPYVETLPPVWRTYTYTKDDGRNLWRLRRTDIGDDGIQALKEAFREKYKTDLVKIIKALPIVRSDQPNGKISVSYGKWTEALNGPRILEEKTETVNWDAAKARVNYKEKIFIITTDDIDTALPLIRYLAGEVNEYDDSTFRSKDYSVVWWLLSDVFRVPLEHLPSYVSLDNSISDLLTR